MALTAPQIVAAWQDIVRQDNAVGVFSKSDLSAAITAADDWATANAASFNAALPQPFRTGATNQQKALLLAYICLRRAGL